MFVYLSGPIFYEKWRTSFHFCPPFVAIINLGNLKKRKIRCHVPSVLWPMHAFRSFSSPRCSFCSQRSMPIENPTHPTLDWQSIFQYMASYSNSGLKGRVFPSSGRTSGPLWRFYTVLISCHKKAFFFNIAFWYCLYMQFSMGYASHIWANYSETRIISIRSGQCAAEMRRSRNTQDSFTRMHGQHHFRGQRGDVKCKIRTLHRGAAFFLCQYFGVIKMSAHLNIFSSYIACPCDKHITIYSPLSKTLTTAPEVACFFNKTEMKSSSWNAQLPRLFSIEL